jgi:hypothetical protein
VKTRVLTFQRPAAKIAAMGWLFVLGAAIVAAGCHAVPATAVSAATIGTFELVNLRELPIPRNVTSIYFEQPILELCAGGTDFLFLRQDRALRSRTDPGNRKRAVRRLNSDEIQRLQELKIYPFPA